MKQQITREIVLQHLPKRVSDGHKGIFGRLGVICGSLDMSGAARLVNRAAYRSGAGLVFAFAGKSFASYLKNDMPEVIVKTVKESREGFFDKQFYQENKSDLENCGTLVFGCGIGQHPELAVVLEDLLLSYKNNILIDADGLNLLSQNLSLLKRKKANVIITPHIKEMSRLTGLSVGDILANKEKTASAFAVQHNITVVLKSYQTIIADPGGQVYVNKTGNSALSKAGTGDVLSGMIAGFLVQSDQLLGAALCGVYLHGLAAELASAEMSEYAVMATDVADYLSKSIIKINH